MAKLVSELVVSVKDIKPISELLVLLANNFDELPEDVKGKLIEIGEMSVNLSEE